MNRFRMLGGILLVAGTTIGGGILALPVATAQLGFFPALLLFLLVWAFMGYTAFLFLEATLVAPKGANLVSMARLTLGPIGEVVAWTSYMLLLYVLMAAYISGTGSLLTEALIKSFEIKMAPWGGPLLWVVVFGLLVYFGIRSVDNLNRFLMVGLVVTYLALVATLGIEVEPKQLIALDFTPFFVPLSLVITTFGFHIIVPSLVNYLDRDVKKSRRCLLIGCLIPLIVYILWEIIILGAVPKEILFQVLKEGQPGSQFAHLLPTLTGKASLGVIMGFFSLFALLTSFLGVSISLADFLRDGFKLSTDRLGRLVLVVLTFLPPFGFALFYPNGFIVALDYGGLFVAILLGLLPTAMIWRARYVKNKEIPYQVKGGKGALLTSFCFFSLVVILFFLYRGRGV